MVRRGPLATGGEALGAKAPWITFLAGTGAIVLRFLVGAELDPNVFRAQMEGARPGWLLRPFFSGPLGGTQCTRLGVASRLAYWRNRYDDFGAVVYAVMLELGFNQTTYGTVLALGLIFSPFTKKTLLLPAISLVSLLIFAVVTGRFFERHRAAHPNWRPSTCCFGRSDLAA